MILQLPNVFVQDDGWVHIKYYEYPLPMEHKIRNLTAEHLNNTYNRNFNATLT